MNDKINRLCTFVLLFSWCSIFCYRVVPGDTSGTASFTFPLGTQAHSSSGTVIFVGALNAGQGKEYALSLWGSSNTEFTPWAPELATLNGIPDQPNPLYDAAITRLGMLDQLDAGQMSTLRLPLAVTQALPANLYFVQDIRRTIIGTTATDSALTAAAEDIKDSTGVTTQEIIAVEGFEKEAIFAAVIPASGAGWGEPGSGIAVVQLQTEKIDDCPQTILAQINADPASTTDEPLASPLDITSPAVSIGGDAAGFTDVVDLYYSDRLKRLYVALQVTGGAGSSDGARGVVVGRLVDKKLIFQPIAPDGVFTLQDKIVGATGAGVEISIEKVRTMTTTTGLDYLVVVGNVGTPGGTANQVYALPLVNSALYDDPVQGTLADVSALPETFYTNDTGVCTTLPQEFVRRAFVVPATQPDQVYTQTSVQALVAGASLPAGTITDINVSNDAVFVSVADPEANQLPGIFYAQALFDANGAIAAWTPWQRVAGTTDPVYSFAYRAPVGSFAWLTGQTSTTVDVVKESVWGLGSVDGLGNLVTTLNTVFAPACGGIQGFFDLPLTTPGLVDISLYIATGFKKIALVQSGETVAGTYEPATGNFSDDMQTFTAGEITQTFPIGNSRLVVISGGALDTIGAITAATLGVNGTTNEGYLFVGGASGLAVLAQPNGSGWPTVNALGPNFFGLQAGMVFTLLDDYSFVRKLIFDAGFLYVLTDTRLDRIDIAASDFATGMLSVVTLAFLDNVGNECTTFFDVVISDVFALLATSNGLYRVGNDGDIQTAANGAAVGWISVPIPEGVPVVQQLQPISSNNLPNGLAKSNNGNLYILDAYIGLAFGQENRYVVQSVVSQPIDNDTIVPLPDIKVKGRLSPFTAFNQYVHLINFDGTDNFFARNRKLIKNSALRGAVSAWEPMLFDRVVRVPLEIENYNYIVSMVRSSASGAWLVAGDFGLRVNE